MPLVCSTEQWFFGRARLLERLSARSSIEMSGKSELARTTRRLAAKSSALH